MHEQELEEKAVQQEAKLLDTCYPQAQTHGEPKCNLSRGEGMRVNPQQPLWRRLVRC